MDWAPLSDDFRVRGPVTIVRPTSWREWEAEMLPPPTSEEIVDLPVLSLFDDANPSTTADLCASCDSHAGLHSRVPLLEANLGPCPNADGQPRSPLSDQSRMFSESYDSLHPRTSFSSDVPTPTSESDCLQSPEHSRTSKSIDLPGDAHSVTSESDGSLSPVQSTISKSIDLQGDVHSVTAELDELSSTAIFYGPGTSSAGIRISVEEASTITKELRMNLKRVSSSKIEKMKGAKRRALTPPSSPGSSAEEREDSESDDPTYKPVRNVRIERRNVRRSTRHSPRTVSNESEHSSSSNEVVPSDLEDEIGTSQNFGLSTSGQLGAAPKPLSATSGDVATIPEADLQNPEVSTTSASDVTSPEATPEVACYIEMCSYESLR